MRWSSAGHLPPLLLRGPTAPSCRGQAGRRLLGSGSGGRTRATTRCCCRRATPSSSTPTGIIGPAPQCPGIDEGTDRLTAHPSPPLRTCHSRLSATGCYDRVPRGARANNNIAILALRCGPAAGRRRARARRGARAEGATPRPDHSTVPQRSARCGGAAHGGRIWAVRGPGRRSTPARRCWGAGHQPPAADLTAHRRQLAAAPCTGGGRRREAEEGCRRKGCCSPSRNWPPTPCATAASGSGRGHRRRRLLAARKSSDAAIGRPPTPAVDRDACRRHGAVPHGQHLHRARWLVDRSAGPLGVHRLHPRRGARHGAASRPVRDRRPGAGERPRNQANPPQVNAGKGQRRQTFPARPVDAPARVRGTCHEQYRTPAIAAAG